MKEVMAVIRMNKMNQTKHALAEAGVASFTARRVSGRGKGKVDYLLMKAQHEDWRGVSDAANDLREMDAREKK